MPLSENPRKTPMTFAGSKSRMAFPGLSVAPVGDAASGQAQRVDDVLPFRGDKRADRADEAVLDDVNVEVGDAGVGVGLLEAEWVERHRDPGRRIRLQVTEDRL